MGSQVIVSLTRQAIKQGLNVRIGARGTSMFPYIWPGDMVTFRPLKEGERPEVGAVTVTETDKRDRFILHRVVKVDGDVVITRGDSNMMDDAPHQPEQVVGIMTKVESSRFHFAWHVNDGHGLWSKWMLRASPVSHRINHTLARVAQGVNILLKRLGLRRRREIAKA